MGVITMITVLVVNMTGGSTTAVRYLSHLHEGQLELREDTGQDLLLILIEITTGLLLDDLEVVDEHPCGVEIHLGFSG